MHQHTQSGAQESKPQPADNIANSHYPSACPQSSPDDSACHLDDNLVSVATIDNLRLPGGFVRLAVYTAIDCIHLFLSGFVANYAEPLDLPPEAQAAVQPRLQVLYQLVFTQVAGPVLIQIERHLKRNLAVAHHTPLLMNVAARRVTASSLLGRVYGMPPAICLDSACCTILSSALALPDA